MEIINRKVIVEAWIFVSEKCKKTVEDWILSRKNNFLVNPYHIGDIQCDIQRHEKQISLLKYQQLDEQQNAKLLSNKNWINWLWNLETIYSIIKGIRFMCVYSGLKSKTTYFDV